MYRLSGDLQPVFFRTFRGNIRKAEAVENR